MPSIVTSLTLNSRAHLCALIIYQVFCRPWIWSSKGKLQLIFACKLIGILAMEKLNFGNWFAVLVGLSTRRWISMVIVLLGQPADTSHEWKAPRFFYIPWLCSFHNKESCNIFIYWPAATWWFALIISLRYMSKFNILSMANTCLGVSLATRSHVSCHKSASNSISALDCTIRDPQSDNVKLLFY